MAEQKKTMTEFEYKQDKLNKNIEIAAIMFDIKNKPGVKNNAIAFLKAREIIKSKAINPQDKTIEKALQQIGDIKTIQQISQGITTKSYIPVKSKEFAKQQKPPSKYIQSNRKGGTGEIMSQSEVSSIPKKMQAKQPKQINQPEENKEESKSIKSVKGSIKDDSSISQGSKSSKSSKEHQLLETLSNDSKLSRRIPQINQAKQNALKGNITEDQKYQQISQAIMENMNSNKVVNSMVMDIIDQTIKSKPSSQKSSKSVKSQMQKQPKSAYGGMPQIFDDDDTERNDQNNNLGGSDQLIKPMVKPVFVQAEVKNDNVAIYKDHLQKIADQHGGDVSKKAQEMIKQMERSTFEAEDAVDSIQEPHIPEQNQPVQEVVTSMITAPQLQPQVQTITDFLEKPQFGTWLEDWMSKSNLTDEQRGLAIRTLRDVDSANDLVSQQLQGLGYSDDKSVVQKGSSKKSNTSSVSRQIRSLNPKSRDSSQMFSIGDHQISEEFIKETMQQTIDKISKIVGDIPTIATYSTFQKQTEVFGTKIKKKESNSFAVKQGSAFRLRQCQ